MTDTNSSHCPQHSEYHETLITVANNTNWIISALKGGAAVAGAFFTVIILPASIWLINLDKRVTNIETHIAYQTKK